MESGNRMANGSPAKALWYSGPGVCELLDETCGTPKRGEVHVRSLASGISRGTERLVFEGKVPESEWHRMRAPFQTGGFPFPVKYGYANVGEVCGGDAKHLGSRVFSLFPHQSEFVLAADACVSVPEDIPTERAVLAANMETALNGLWDGKPSPGDHICVVGGGVVGLLTGYLCARLPATRVTLIDRNPSRSEIAGRFGMEFTLPDAAPSDQDLVFHASATAAGLATALRTAGDGVSVVEMSWYGAGTPAVPLGADFHSRRLRLVSSQVGAICAERMPRWSFRRRLETALALLADPVLDILISKRVPFSGLPGMLPEILNPEEDVLAAVVVYDR